ncbi:NAD-binding protein [Bythopirellula goksoeyrii]|uniref:Pyridine nucleotide-disulphide oxidoreductase N-terminal domain-containing protein n=1 Tax=Bythopirellula goksoeyrii TaxID=1400387 RepID=A0A5B9QC74_9BACT|nr:NAD-binding protein [Bythopirellula goksoeyrii]QEG36634.1 hypothetical protein Pr1d_39490 [Bythopirellula goksoeyrii]
MSDEDFQPRIAILGAGPIGLEAAIYARYLGYSAEVFEREELPAKILHHAEERVLDRPFSERVSTLGVAALQAQDSKWKFPASSASLSAAEYYRSYLLPLAESDLVSDSLRLGMEVVSVSRDTEEAWQIACRSKLGQETEFGADVVIDCRGKGSENFVEEEGQSTESLCFLNPVADYYVLGSKSCVTAEEFLFASGLAQIRELFAILGEREDLDVYATMPPIEWK